MSVLSLILLTITLAACGSGEAAETAVAERGSQPVLVEVFQVGNQAVASTVEILANVLPRKQVKIIPRVPGVIESVLVEEGQRVTEGQVIATLEKRDYLLAVRQAQANLQSARANARLAKIMADSASTQAERMKVLHRTDAISRSKLDQSSDGELMGAARADAAVAQVRQAQVGLDAARIKLADTEIVAPYAGLVVKRLMDEGEICGMMPPGIIMIVADVDWMKIEGSVGEMDLRVLEEGMAATVRVDALGGEEIQGTIELISPMVDPRTRTAGVRVVVENSGHRLEMGMSAEISIDLGHRDIIAVPADAVIRSSGTDRTEVFVVDRENKARRREIRLGERRGEMFDVVEGLSVGERVVRSGHSSLDDGRPVVLAEEAEGAG